MAQQGYATPEDWFKGSGIRHVYCDVVMPEIPGLTVLCFAYNPEKWAHEDAKEAICKYLREERQAIDIRFKIVRGLGSSRIAVYFR